MSTSPRLVTDVPTLPERPLTMHKGQAGRIALVAGSRGMSGAAVLAALGALRGGAGLVRVYCPAAVQPVIAASEPCLMTVPLEGATVTALAQPVADDNWADCMAVGPGLGEGAAAVAMARAAFAKARRVVVDADGLNPLATDGPLGFGAAPAVVTPHPGEMARLCAGAGLNPQCGDDDETRVRVAHEYALLAGCVVVLKGYRTVVCDRDAVFINGTGNPGMATGGMGDVLTGLIAALIGQGLQPFDAARLGVHVHGLAADLCAREIGPVGYLARDVVDRIPAALRQSRESRIGFH